MKFIGILLTGLALAAGISSSAQNLITADEVSVSISGTTSREQLFEIRTGLLQYGLDFRYEPQFDNQRKLRSIHYQVSDQQTGSVIGVADSAGDLQNPGVTTAFRLVRTNGVFAATCFGVCE
jgi:hypothetical protein